MTCLRIIASPRSGRSLRLSVRTPDFQSGKTGSIPVGTATLPVFFGFPASVPDPDRSPRGMRRIESCGICNKYKILQDRKHATRLHRPVYIRGWGESHLLSVLFPMVRAICPFSVCRTCRTGQIAPSLRGSGVDPSWCLVDGSGAARDLDECHAKHGSEVAARCPIFGQMAADGRGDVRPRFRDMKSSRPARRVRLEARCRRSHSAN